jgi:hypothetical protein
MTDGEVRKSNSRRRVLLDTNVWRYLVDSRSQGALLRLAQRGKFVVQIAPGVLYEALRVKDGPLRSALVKLMTDLRFQRLMPEAYSESMEILLEITRLRPDWLRKPPDLQFADRLKKDWTRKTGGFWVRCARSPESEAGFIQQLEGSMIEDARNQSKFARKEMMNSGWKNNPPMDKTLVSFNYAIPGWRGDEIEAWRVDAWTSLSYSVGMRGDAYRDWLGPFVELEYGLLSSEAWVEFWFYLADSRRVPRQWIRWAHAFAQRFRRVTPGSPADSQLFTYFLDTDIVVTGDRALLEILDECRPYAPCKLPDGKLIPAGALGVSDLLQMLSAE